MMETHREDLGEARREMLWAEASPYLDYPRPGWWYPLATVMLAALGAAAAIAGYEHAYADAAERAEVRAS